MDKILNTTTSKQEVCSPTNVIFVLLDLQMSWFFYRKTISRI